MQGILNLIKWFLPESVTKKIRPLGHGFFAFVSAWRNRWPSEKMIVVGVTGTAGKSTTVHMLAKILNQNGMRCGFVTTAGFFDGKNEEVNAQGISMPGRKFGLQKFLRTMVENGCKVAIVEATSEGLAQNRHYGINFDIALLTNLDRAHLEAHGGFENYKRAKGRLFAALEKSSHKTFFKKKMIGIGLDTLEDDYFLKFRADYKFAVSQRDPELELVQKELNRVFYVWQVQTQGHNSIFKVNDQDFVLHMPGKFNVTNAALASGCAEALGIGLAQSAAALQEFTGVSGRLQKISNGHGLQIYVDYAPEPVAMRSVLESLQQMPHRKIIHVFGSTGGHRDIAKRAEFGGISARFADVIIVTNDDVYNSDPKAIANDIIKGIEQTPARERRNSEVHVVLDRREAIHSALDLARPEDLVIITGKGSEQFLVLPGNKRVPWDEKEVVEEILAQHGRGARA